MQKVGGLLWPRRRGGRVGSGGKTTWCSRKESRMEEPKASSLPQDWEEHRDEYGRKYFFNIATGESTWHRPVQVIVRSGKHHTYQVTIKNERDRQQFFAGIYRELKGSFLSSIHSQQRTQKRCREQQKPQQQLQRPPWYNYQGSPSNRQHHVSLRTTSHPQSPYQVDKIPRMTDLYKEAKRKRLHPQDYVGFIAEKTGLSDAMPSFCGGGKNGSNSVATSYAGFGSESPSSSGLDQFSREREQKTRRRARVGARENRNAAKQNSRGDSALVAPSSLPLSVSKAAATLLMVEEGGRRKDNEGVDGRDGKRRGINQGENMVPKQQSKPETESQTKQTTARERIGDAPCSSLSASSFVAKSPPWIKAPHFQDVHEDLSLSLVSSPLRSSSLVTDHKAPLSSVAQSKRGKETTTKRGVLESTNEEEGANSREKSAGRIHPKRGTRPFATTMEKNTTKREGNEKNDSGKKRESVSASTASPFRLSFSSADKQRNAQRKLTRLYRERLRLDLKDNDDLILDSILEKERMIEEAKETIETLEAQVR